MLNCKDLNCVKEVAKELLEKEGVKENFDVTITDLPYNVISVLENGTVKINAVKYDSFSIQTSGEYEINASYLLIAILYAFMRDKNRIKDIVKRNFGEESVVYRLIDIVL